MQEYLESEQYLSYSALSNLVIGFHGCSKEVYDKILKGDSSFKSSVNDYDWLGHGMYFWEQNLERAWEWANNNIRKTENFEPAVIGAVIDLGFCLNLLNSNDIQVLKNQYAIFEVSMNIAGRPIKKNKNVGNNKDLLLRYLDCAVIESLHDEREQNSLMPFDSVRGVFIEGNPIYESSGFYEKSHIQLCIRNPNCIKGFFAPRSIINDWRIP